jgi:hypothetical protein
MVMLKGSGTFKRWDLVGGLLSYWGVALEGIKEVLRDLVSSCKMAPPCFLAPYLIM